MAAPVEREFVTFAAGLSRSTTSATQANDLIFCITATSTTVTGIPNHTTQGGWTLWGTGTQTVDDGATDGRVSVAYKLAAGGVESCQAFTASTGTSTTGLYVLQVGTFDTGENPWASTSATTNAAPNPPALTNLTGDYKIIALGVWCYASATANTPTAPANYTLKDHLAGSAINDVAYCIRDMTGLSSSTEDPAAITDNTAPACTMAVTFAIKSGVTQHTADVNETVSLSESIGAVYATTAGPNETVSLSEAIATGWVATVGLPETVALSEALQAGILYTVGVSETVTLSESLVAVYNAIAGINETVSVAESIAAQYNGTLSLIETVTLAEALDSLTSFYAVLDETVGLAELLSALTPPAPPDPKPRRFPKSGWVVAYHKIAPRIRR